MAISDSDRALIDEFLDYVEGLNAPDDRYGTPRRHTDPQGRFLATRFEVGIESWLEVVVEPAGPVVSAGFGTRRREDIAEIERSSAEGDGSPEGALASAFAEVGLTWPDTPLDREETADGFRLFTPLDLDELPDLELQDIRDQTVKMLEAYLIAFGALIDTGEPTEEDEFDDED